MIQIETLANVNHWRGRPVEMFALSGGLLALALILPTMPFGFVIFLLSSSLIIFGARTPWKMYLRILALPVSFMIAGSAAIFFSVSFGDTGFSISLSDEGIKTASVIIVRSLAAFSAMLLLVLTTTISDILMMLQRFHFPPALTDLMGLTYRFLFVLNDTFRNLIRSQKTRLGYSGLKNSYRSLTSALAALFLQTLERAKQMESALASRGYTGNLNVLSNRRKTSRAALTAILCGHALLILTAVLWTM